MGKSIIIIGAGEGVGIETAKYFGKKGYSVGLIRRGLSCLKEMAEKLSDDGITTYYETADANEPDQIEKAIKILGDKMSGIDVLYYNVPGPLAKACVPAIEISTPLITEFLNMRVISSLRAAQAALPYLKISKGSILYTSGPSDRHAYPNTAVIGVPQAALRHLAQHLHNELKEQGIFVGYLPLDNPPLYSDPEKEKARTDVPEGFRLDDERVVSSYVAEVSYQLSIKRDQFDCPVHSTSKKN